MSQGWPSFSSMKLSKATPIRPAGMVLMSSSQASFSSRVSILTPPDAAEEGLEQAPHVDAHEHEDGDERAQVQGHVERLLEVERHGELPVEQPGDQDAGGPNWIWGRTR